MLFSSIYFLPLLVAQNTKISKAHRTNVQMSYTNLLKFCQRVAGVTRIVTEADYVFKHS